MENISEEEQISIIKVSFSIVNGGMNVAFLVSFHTNSDENQTVSI